MTEMAGLFDLPLTQWAKLQFEATPPKEIVEAALAELGRLELNTMAPALVKARAVDFIYHSNNFEGAGEPLCIRDPRVDQLPQS